jgi:ATP-binding cassette subfamily B multidrug efflux pump
MTTANRIRVIETRASVIRYLAALLAERRGAVAIVGTLVLAAAAVELAPPLVIRDIVDRHLTIGRAEGLPALALVYLVAVAAIQALTFLYGYVAAAAAQGALSDLRTRLFAHVQRLPASYFDQVPVGDVISRCTADIDALDSVFSSGVALLLSNLMRLVTIAVANTRGGTRDSPRDRGRQHAPAGGPARD